MKSPTIWLIALAALWCVFRPPAVAIEPLGAADIRQNLFSTCFVSDREGWVVGELGRVLHTTDGGKSFTRVTTGTKIAFLSVDCLADGTIVVVGQYGRAMRSRDAGTSWETLETGTDKNLLSVAFASPRVGVAVGDYGTLIRTEDGGTMWSPVPLPEAIPLPEEIAEIIQPGDVLLYDATFATPVRGWIVGEFGVIFTTGDAGNTWVAQASPVETTLFGVAFVDSQTGWATGIEEVMLHTTDGGATWKRQSVPARSGFVLALYDVAVQGRIGWAIGDSGSLLRSTDAGVTWERVALPIQLAANWFRGVALTPNLIGLIVGSEGLMLGTDRDQYRQLGKRS